MDYDLNIKLRSSKDKDRALVAMRAIELGYSCIAWNITAFGKIGPNSQYKPLPPVPLNTIQLKKSDRQRSMVAPAIASLRQFSRITLSVDDVSEAQVLASANDMLAKFDVIAASPANAKVLSYLCRQGDIDIISLDFTHRLQFPLNKKMLDVAVARGICFEIQYSPVLTAPASRRQVISTTRVLVQYLKGKGVILTSGAEALGHMRGPVDVLYLAELLGIPRHHARMTVSENCALVLKHAAARRLRYAPVELIGMTEFYRRWPELREVSCQFQSTSTGHTAGADVTEGSNTSADDEAGDDSSEEEIRGKRGRGEWDVEEDAKGDAALNSGDDSGVLGSSGFIRMAADEENSSGEEAESSVTVSPRVVIKNGNDRGEGKVRTKRKKLNMMA